MPQTTQNCIDPGTKIATGASAKILSANDGRRFFRIRAESTNSAPVFLKFANNGTADANSFALPAGQEIVEPWGGEDRLYTGEVYVFSAAAQVIYLMAY